MHVVFMVCGRKQSVDHMFMDMQAQKFPLINTKGDDKKAIYLQGTLRYSILGTWEYVFPRESRDIVMTTLGFNTERYPQHKLDLRKWGLRKVLKCKPIPKKFDSSQKLLWVTNDVAVIPIGIREDTDLVETDGEFKGYTHEAL